MNLQVSRKTLEVGSLASRVNLDIPVNGQNIPMQQQSEAQQRVIAPLVMSPV